MLPDESIRMKGAGVGPCTPLPPCNFVCCPPILTPLDEHPLLEATIVPTFARLATASFLGFRYRRLCRELRALTL